MRLNVEINGLTERHWAAVRMTLKESYDFAHDDDPRVCVVFEAEPGSETSDVHVEMPVEEFRGLLISLNIADSMVRSHQRQRQTDGAIPEQPIEKTGWPYERYGPAPVPTVDQAADDADFLSRPAGADQ